MSWLLVRSHTSYDVIFMIHFKSLSSYSSSTNNWPFYFALILFGLYLIIALFSLYRFNRFFSGTMSITSPRFKQFPAKTAVSSYWSPTGPAPYSFTYDNLLKCLYLRNESRAMRTPENISDSALRKGNNKLFVVIRGYKCEVNQ